MLSIRPITDCGASAVTSGESDALSRPVFIGIHLLKSEIDRHFSAANLHSPGAILHSLCRFLNGKFRNRAYRVRTVLPAGSPLCYINSSFSTGNHRFSGAILHSQGQFSILPAPPSALTLPSTPASLAATSDLLPISQKNEKTAALFNQNHSKCTFFWWKAGGGGSGHLNVHYSSSAVWSLFGLFEEKLSGSVDLQRCSKAYPAAATAASPHCFCYNIHHLLMQKSSFVIRDIFIINTRCTTHKLIVLQGKNLFMHPTDCLEGLISPTIPEFQYEK